MPPTSFTMTFVTDIDANDPEAKAKTGAVAAFVESFVTDELNNNQAFKHGIITERYPTEDFAVRNVGVDLHVNPYDDDPVCVCGTHRSEHQLCGCGEWQRAT